MIYNKLGGSPLGRGPKKWMLSLMEISPCKIRTMLNFTCLSFPVQWIYSNFSWKLFANAYSVHVFRYSFFLYWFILRSSSCALPLMSCLRKLFKLDYCNLELPEQRLLCNSAPRLLNLLTNFACFWKIPACHLSRPCLVCSLHTVASLHAEEVEARYRRKLLRS